MIHHCMVANVSLLCIVLDSVPTVVSTVLHGGGLQEPCLSRTHLLLLDERQSPARARATSAYKFRSGSCSWPSTTHASCTRTVITALVVDDLEVLVLEGCICFSLVQPCLSIADSCATNTCRPPQPLQQPQLSLQMACPPHLAKRSCRLR